MIRRMMIVAVAAIALLVFGAPAAMADPEVGGDEGTVVIEDNNTHTHVEPGGDPVYTVPVPYTEYRYVIACSINSPSNPDDVMCTGATAGCDDGEMRYRVYTRERNADGSLADGAGWDARGSLCRGPDDPPEGGPEQITTVDISERAEEAAPESVVHVQPGDKSYVNVPTNFFAGTGTTDASVTVLGTQVDLQFDPAGYEWNFGDGGSAGGAGVKNAAVGAADAVEHGYQRRGEYGITLTRSFTVTYQIAGGPTGRLPSPVSSTSEEYPLQIGEVQTVVTRVD
jgi:hypothetical protein